MYGALRSAFAHRRFILVLDDAASIDQVEPLLPGLPASAILITSRRPLLGLHSAESVEVKRLSTGEGVRLFRLASGLAEADETLATRIVETCGRVPLAIRVIAARVQLPSRRGRGLEELAHMLRSDDDYRNELKLEGFNIRGSIRFSIDELPEKMRQGLALLALLPAGRQFGRGVAQVLFFAAGIADGTLDTLVDAQLVEMPTVGRYQLHDLIRLYAEEDLEDASRLEAVLNLYEWLKSEAHDPTTRLYHGQYVDESDQQDLIDSLEELEREAGTCVATVRHLMKAGMYDRALDLSLSIAPLFSLRSRWEDWRRLAELGEIASRDAADSEGRTMALSILADTRAKAGRNEEAIDLLREAEETSRTCSVSTRARALTSLGDVLFRAGHQLEAEPVIQQALELCTVAGDMAGRGSALNLLGMISRFRGELLPAMDLFVQASEAARASKDWHSVGTVDTNLALVYVQLGRWDDAVAAFRRDIDICQRLGDRHGEAVTGIYLASLFVDQGDLTEATRLATNALDTMRELSDRWQQACAHNILGKVRYRQSQWREARTSFLQSAELMVAVGDQSGEVVALMNAANTDLMLGELDAAISRLREATIRLKVEGDVAGAANAMLNLANAYKEAKKLEDALNQVIELIAYLHGSENVQIRARAVAFRGALYWELGDLEEAANDLREAERLFQEMGDEYGLANVHFSMGVVASSGSDLLAAQSLLERAVEGLRRVDDRHALSRALNALGNAYASLRRDRYALTAFADSLEIAKALGDLATARSVWRNAVRTARNASLESEVRLLFSDWADYERSRDVAPIDPLEGWAGFELTEGNALDSLTLLEQLLPLLEATGDRPRLGASRVNVGAAYEMLGRPAAARRCYTQAVEELAGDDHPYTDFRRRLEQRLLRRSR